jgi:hypothetical protein
MPFLEYFQYNKKVIAFIRGEHQVVNSQAKTLVKTTTLVLTFLDVHLI